MNKPLVCIKIGGSIMDRSSFFAEFAAGVALLQKNYTPVIVHGGGKEISRQLELLNRPTVFVEGMRVTDAESVGVVQMVLSGSVNKRLVNALQGAQVCSIGLSGVDGGLFLAERLLINGNDIGFVGTVKAVNRTVIDVCTAAAIVPVVSPISRDEQGTIYNVNADVAASELAVALCVDHLVFVSDVAGVLIDKKVAHELHPAAIEEHIVGGAITGGMIPKVRAAVEALTRGVGQVHICAWSGAGTLVNELTKDNMTGTTILR